MVWKFNDERGALIHNAVKFDFSVHQVHVAGYDVKPQTRAWDIARIMGPKKGFKKVPLVSMRYTDSIIPDRNREVSWVYFCVKFNKRVFS
jgi:hypothetical protein